MNFDVPAELTSYLETLGSFIECTILPLQRTDDNNRFFDHRQEYARTDWTQGGIPPKEWEGLIDQARVLADRAGFYRFALPQVYGGQEHPDTNLWMSVIRFHSAAHPGYGGGLGTDNDLRKEHSVVGNFPDILMMHHFGTPEQRASFIPQRLRGRFRVAVGLTQPDHGSGATFLSTRASPVGEGFEITGRKKWQMGAHHCTHLIIFARPSGRPGSARGITAFLVARETPGVRVSSFEWSSPMPTDHATVELEKVWVPASSVLGRVDHGLAIA
ncbi:acyl-CoA dehydrogenase family protein [Aspergillus clavatus NRRL 1]|uniref:Acyl-CoA dehydrogenase, putative n=1 Tax=Aspergillus clavatus (strain ATCC 1007 / CBS 513.65 / DSM 816 / NCTC 3887 / NRRL 1 / QM 1276 / 107) TaxID=344612 RepID=A1C8X2_ASPCL|nr:acyl-CoA dehydrogenase, putative [Aspergillus clavatus NRRL 1]EAW13759.1 acyl-CoA dehydrogenase, putative [Aspergillus clavatus NRRL 1]